MAEPLADPSAFGRSFAGLWAGADAVGLADLCVTDADFLTLTGYLAEGQDAILAALEADLAGPLAGSRLVTGKAKVRALGPFAVVISQRYMLVGLNDAQGQDLGRINAVLTATIQATPEGWRAVSLAFAALQA